MMRLRSLALVSLGGLLVAATARAQAPEPPLQPFLRKTIQLTDAQLAAVDHGDVVTKQLPSPEKQEIAAFGAVRINGKLEALRERMRDWRSFRKVPQVPEIGSFSNPPSIDDLKALTWENGDLDDIKKCKTGECEVKADAASIERIRKEIDWSARDAKQKVTAVIKEQMLRYIVAYLSDGTDAMGVIVDKSKPKALSDEFKMLLKDSPYLLEYVPSFNQYLVSYPKGSLPNVENTLYWTKDTFGLTPVVSMYHATIYRPETSRPTLLVAIKTLYASHYFNATLEIMAAVETADAGTPGFYLLDLYRTRIDLPTGMLSGVLLGKVKGGIEQGVSMNLKTAKARVEGH